MMLRARERGEGNLGCILWLIVLLLVGMVLWKVLPVKIANAELYDYMVEQAKFAGNKRTDELKKRILIKAKDLKLPIRPEQVTVEKERETIRIRCTYTVVLEFPGYDYEWKVDHQVERQIYYL